MEDLNFRKGDAKTEVFGSNRMLQPSPVEKIPDGPTTPEIAYQMVKDETFAQTQPRLNLATFVTTYMDEYATKLMNEAININYIDETEYPRIAVMNGKCINIVANLWNSPEKETWKTGALAIGSSEACMLGGVAAWLRWRKKRQAQGKPFDKPNFVISTGFQVVWEKFAQLWQIEMREVPLTLDKTTLDPEEALKMCDENTICIVPIQGVTWTGLNDDVEALDKALDAYNAKTGYDIPIHVDAASGGIFPHSSRGNRPGKRLPSPKGWLPQRTTGHRGPVRSGTWQGHGRKWDGRPAGLLPNWDGKCRQESAAAWICLHRWFPPVHRYSRAGSPAKDCLPLHSGQRVWSDSV